MTSLKHVGLQASEKNLFKNSIFIHSNSVSSRWQPQRIPISHLDACHLINFEQQLLPVLISYCQYLNFMDTDTKRIQLNLAALEKCIMDQFVLGKPFIMFDVPLIVFKRELTSTLRKKIIQVYIRMSVGNLSYYLLYFNYYNLCLPATFSHVNICIEISIITFVTI